MSAPRSLAELEKQGIEQALDYTKGNQREAARVLGISPRTMYNKIKEYGLKEWISDHMVCPNCGERMKWK